MGGCCPLWRNGNDERKLTYRAYVESFKERSCDVCCRWIPVRRSNRVGPEVAPTDIVDGGDSDRGRVVEFVNVGHSGESRLLRVVRRKAVFPCKPLSCFNSMTSLDSTSIDSYLKEFEDVGMYPDSTSNSQEHKVDVSGQGVVNPVFQDDDGDGLSSPSPHCFRSTVDSASSFPKKPSLLFLHGVGGSADTWSSQLSYFQEHGYNTYSVDLPGHGFSNSPDDAKAYSFHVLKDNILSVFDQLFKRGEKVIVIGHSYGALFAACVAHERSDQVPLLVMVSGGGPTPLSPPLWLIEWPSWVMTLTRPFFFRKARRSMLYGEHRRRVSLAQAFDIPPLVLYHTIRGQVWPEGDSSFYRHITIPTLLVYGLKDGLVTLVEECEMERTIPRAHLELIPEAGHMIMLETPNRLNHVIHRFLIQWKRKCS